ncbi:hypothetical protein BCR32DRAFT_241610 [Anaeromyces robustus]|uniref:Mid2 domain-containing protein n=1 Tax=Anaeromyces robustus TaxID=1754192 RepID=A0A1Y1XIS7_9FUNG|nr:hypothetical protein BCR32DRAFT_241610 [Anaeromyces robustus]|eukprot:ORX85659.1 hypothetical protein BCR32DRAFT_241610 [Anaeromyces robustus]
MKVNILYLFLIITVFCINLGYTQSLVEILNDKETEEYLEQSINDFFGSLNDALFPQSNAVSNEPLRDVTNKSNRRVQPRPSTVKDDSRESQIDKIWKDDDDEAKAEPEQETKSNPPPNIADINLDDEEDDSTNNLVESPEPEVKKTTTVAPKTTTTVVRTTTVTTQTKPKTTQPPQTQSPKTQPPQNVNTTPVSPDPKSYPPPDVSKNEEEEITNGLVDNKNKNNNNSNSNNNNSVPSSNPKSYPPPTENGNSSNNNSNDSSSITNNNNEINTNQNEQTSTQENPVPVTDNTIPVTENQSSDNPIDITQVKPNANGSIDNVVNPDNKQDGNKNEKKKGGILSILLKVGIGITVGGICFAGLLVGKSKFKDSDDSYDNIYSCNSIPATISTNTLNKSKGFDNDTMALAPTPDNYSKNLPSNYLKPNIPVDSFPTNQEFINTNSIEPLPNLVNKVDVELPVYNIQEENYNTVGRPLLENAVDEDDKTKLLNEGYNNIVPEMGEMVIEHTNCPSFTSSMFEALDELENQSNEGEDGNKMKQIIPDIRYATVEVNNEFENITMDEDVNNDGMKQIIPDIQYATVEVNNEFAGIDDDDDDNYSQTNSRIVVDIDANRSLTTRSSDVEELRTSEFLAISDSMDSFKSISETYRNALRGTFDGGNRDTFSSNDSILHKLH